MKHYCLIVCCILLYSCVFTQPATLDPGFGDGGKSILNIGSSADVCGTVAWNPSDGSIIAAGYTQKGSDADIALAKYRPDGTLDPAFGVGGRVETDYEGGDDGCYGMLILPSGKILVAGSGADFTVTKFTPEGKLYTGFGQNGLATTDIAGGNDFANAIAILPDTRIVLAGTAQNGDNTDVALVRYLNSFVVGIDDFAESQASLLVYPNPLSGTFRLKYALAAASPVSIRLVDAQGRTVHRFFQNEPRYSGWTEESLVLPAGLPAGAYVIQIDAAGKMASVRVVIGQ